jgi:hypothetical protein
MKPSVLTPPLMFFPPTTLSLPQRLRGNLRDAGSLENTITALQIASLRRINSGTKVVLLDRYGSTARAVAKELARKGFSQVYTITGG